MNTKPVAKQFGHFEGMPKDWDILYPSSWAKWYVAVLTRRNWSYVTTKAASWWWVNKNHCPGYRGRSR